MHFTIEERRALAEHEVTLDGQRAVICGIQNYYACVAQLPDGKTAYFAWPTVKRVVERDGAFTS